MKRLFVFSCILGGIFFTGSTSVNAYEEEDVPNYGYVYLNQGGNQRLNQDILDQLYPSDNSGALALPDTIKRKPHLFDFAEPKNPEVINEGASWGGEENRNPVGYPLSIEDLNNVKEYEGPGKAFSLSLDYLKYFKNLESADIGGLAATDFRPIENNKNLKELTIVGPISSTRFISKLKKLEQLTIYANELDGSFSTDEDDFGEDFYNYKDTEINAITDITFLNYLDNLKHIEIESTDRDFPSIGLKKGESKYQLVNPFVVSKQFNGADIEITSDTGEFKFENNILTWDNIDSEAEFLNIQWNFVTGENSFTGNSRIPIHWVD